MKSDKFRGLSLVVRVVELVQDVERVDDQSLDVRGGQMNLGRETWNRIIKPSVKNLGGVQTEDSLKILSSIKNHFLPFESNQQKATSPETQKAIACSYPSG